MTDDEKLRYFREDLTLDEPLTAAGDDLAAITRKLYAEYCRIWPYDHDDIDPDSQSALPALIASLSEIAPEGLPFGLNPQGEYGYWFWYEYEGNAGYTRA